jgi:hypothetical protein
MMVGPAVHTGGSMNGPVRSGRETTVDDGGACGLVRAVATSAAVGRAAGSFASIRSISSRTPGGRPRLGDSGGCGCLTIWSDRKYSPGPRNGRRPATAS